MPTDDLDISDDDDWTNSNLEPETKRQEDEPLEPSNSTQVFKLNATGSTS